MLFNKFSDQQQRHREAYIKGEPRTMIALPAATLLTAKLVADSLQAVDRMVDNAAFFNHFVPSMADTGI